MSEQQKLYAAFGTSMLLHLLGCAFLVVWTRFYPISFTPDLGEPKQIEVTMMPAPNPEPMTVVSLPKEPSKVTRSTLDSTGLEPSQAPPAKAQFESDIDSQAASELPARGNLPLPTQDGKERPFAEFTSQQSSLGKGERPGPEAVKPAAVAPAPTPVRPVNPQPTPVVAEQAPSTLAPVTFFSPTPVPTPTPENSYALGKPTPTPAPVATPQPTVAKVVASPTPREQLAKLAPPTPMLRAQPETLSQPPRPESGYQPELERTKIDGGITKKGRSGADVIASPIGRYKKSIADAIGSRWYFYVRDGMDLINVGDVHIKFFVNEQGRVEDVKVVSNTANATLGNYCIRSVTEAKIPPLPLDVAPALTDGRLEMDYNFHIYPQ